MRRDARNIIGVDVGGTNVKLALLTHEGETRYMRGFETRSYRPVDAVMADLAAAVRGLAARAASDGVTVHALGLALPATLELKKRQTLVMPNFAGGWYAFPVADALEGATGLPVSLVNDARAFVLAESRLGAGRGVADLFGVVLGTGVGGGVVLGGRLHLGAGGLAGEFGHHVVEPRGLRCGCGGRGCLETVASAPALVASVTRPFLHGRSPLLHDLVGGDLNAVTAQTVSEAARLGDEACLDALERVGGGAGIGDGERRHAPRARAHRFRGRTLKGARPALPGAPGRLAPPRSRRGGPPALARARRRSRRRASWARRSTRRILNIPSSALKRHKEET